MPRWSGKPAPELVAEMMARLRLSGLNEKHATKLEIRPVTSSEAQALGFRSSKAGFVIPYFTLKGKRTDFFRLRHFVVEKDPFTGKDGPKYNQLPGTGNQLYMPPLLKWHEIAQDPSISIIITEGELKAACACSLEMPCLGLGGVWNFKNATNRHLQAFDEFNWEDRIVYICYDSDIVLKAEVAQAENALARELVEMGARPHALRLPQLNDKKTGLDDYLVDPDGGPQNFRTILSAAQDFAVANELFRLNEEAIYVREPNM